RSDGRPAQLARQFTDAGRQDQPLTYYHRSGPLGDVFRMVGEAEISRSVAAVGLGAGAASAFSTEGSSYVFYEIDPQIQRIASDPEVFSYLNRMKGDFEVILGDGRLAMRGAPRDAYGIIILDAFSSDAIPVHLLTLEAVELYLSRLREDGLLVFHISNRFVDFGPLMAGLSRELGLVAMIKKDQEEGNPEHMQGKYPSDYVVMGRAGSVVGEFREVPGWYELARGEAAVLWTDKYSNVLRLLKL
ncbi:MAG: fused MFS/spermidine synthase, partial [Thermodesulfobacteriota bacterium]